MKDTTPPKRPDKPASEIARPALRFDWQDWLPFLEDSNIPEDQKRAWIETLWSIVMNFVDLGFDIKSAPEICGEEIDLKALLEAAVVNSKDATRDTTNQSSSEEDAA